MRELSFNVSRRPPPGSAPPYVGSPPNVRQLEDPIDTAIFAALIDYYRNATPNTISFSDVLNEKVAPLGISPEQVLESIEILESGAVALADRHGAGTLSSVIISRVASTSAPAGYRFPREVIAVAVRWYLRYGLSYRDVEELLAERGIEVDHVTVYRWVQTFTSEFIDSARPARHVSGDRWFVDETYVKVAGRWAYLYRAVDQHGQVIDVLVCERRDGAAARVFFARALTRACRRSKSPPTGHRSTRG
jgi:hypothetical protein